ncbi:orotate phosphoribosyltransferase [bacterium Unc6]|nr:orotate phosphoribosyltransferase [bacterium Unc6]
MNKETVLNIFKKYNALLEGHFSLSSGLHSPNYLQCAILLQYPDVSEILCKEIADNFKSDGITVVAGPAIGGILVAYEIARAIKCRSIFTEKENGRMTLRRGFEINPLDRVLVVEDVITTGGSVLKILELIKEKKAYIAGVGSIVDRSASVANFGHSLGVKFVKLLTINVRVYKQEECPLCKKNIPLTKPGSRK